MDKQNSAAIFLTPVITVVAGDSAEEYVVHAGLLQRESAPRYRKEGVEKRVVFQEVCDATLGRFVEWLYTGECFIPYPEVSYSTPATPLAIAGETDTKEKELKRKREENGSAGAVAKKVGVETRNTLFTAAAERLREIETPVRYISQVVSEHTKILDASITHSSGFQQWLRQFGAYSLKDNPDDFRNLSRLSVEKTLTAYGQLYILASTYLVPNLQAYALRGVYHVLRRLHVLTLECGGSEAVDGIMKLVDLIFSHVPARPRNAEPMRDMLSTYLALEFAAIMAAKEMQDVIGKGGDVAIAVNMKLARLQHSRQKLETLRKDSEAGVDEEERRVFYKNA